MTRFPQSPVGTGTDAIRFEGATGPGGRMSACIAFCLAAAFSIAATRRRGRGFQPAGAGSAPASRASYSDTQSAPIYRSGAPAYSQADITDPYNHRISAPSRASASSPARCWARRRPASSSIPTASASGGHASGEGYQGYERSNRDDIDAAQQHLLDPAATSPTLKAAAADCARVAASFSQLQQMQVHDQALAKKLDQPDAMSPSADSNNSNQGRQPR